MPRTGLSESLRRQLVQGLASRGFIRSARVRDAFLSVPRELFVGEFADREGLPAVYRDEAILTKRDAQGTALSSSSQPAIMALMLEKLGLEKGMRVLEVGAGTGYNAALLSLLVGPRGRVVSVDIDRDLARDARRSLRTGGYRVRVLPGDGREGVSEFAPYDRIVVTASSDTVPRAWFEQLQPGGLLEVPLRLSPTGAQAIPLLRKTRDGLRSVAMLCGGFMPLRPQGEDAAAVLKQPMLVASDATSDGGAPVQQLSGEALRTLSPRARRRLLSIALTEGRRRPLGLRASSSALTLFLSVRVPTRQLVTTAPRYGIGVIARAGTSLAAIEPPFARPRSTVSSVRVFGSEDAEELLLGHVRDWERRGRPSEDDLELTVTFDAGGESHVRTRWPRPFI
ncbi:MAG: methyltransferase domain-containing protein [Actinomycetota bacterium]